MFDGSARNVATLNVSPSEFDMLNVRSSEPKANKLASLQAPQVIACFKKKRMIELTKREWTLKEWNNS